MNQPGHHPAGAAIAGATATVFHDAVMTPMDVIKQRLQLGYHKGMVDCITTIRRTEGTKVRHRLEYCSGIPETPARKSVVALITVKCRM